MLTIRFPDRAILAIRSACRTAHVVRTVGSFIPPLPFVIHPRSHWSVGLLFTGPEGQRLGVRVCLWVYKPDWVARWLPCGSARPPGVKLSFHVPICPPPPRSYARGNRRCVAGYARYSGRVAMAKEAPICISPRTPQPYVLTFPSSLPVLSPVVWRLCIGMEQAVAGTEELAVEQRNRSSGGGGEWFWGRSSKWWRASGGGLVGMNDSRSFRVPHSGDARRRPRCRPATEGRRQWPWHPPLPSSLGSTRSTSAGGFPASSRLLAHMYASWSLPPPSLVLSQLLSLSLYWPPGTSPSRERARGQPKSEEMSSVVLRAGRVWCMVVDVLLCSSSRSKRGDLRVDHHDVLLGDHGWGEPRLAPLPASPQPRARWRPPGKQYEHHLPHLVYRYTASSPSLCTLISPWRQHLHEDMVHK
jgi:hypothetical protein